MARMVQCAKLGMELPGLDAPPFPGPLGQRIYEEISAEAWAMWREAQTIMINHYALNPADPDDRKVLREQMEEFLFGGGGDMPAGWAPAGAGGMSKGGAPARKK
ncbi:MAG TPA: oxidative damage protection protein [Thermomicrobiaceae bacterium]|nr:oxidative damage protection protein [Thermomicrobiaceae bacterium]